MRNHPQSAPSMGTIKSFGWSMWKKFAGKCEIYVKVCAINDICTFHIISTCISYLCQFVSHFGSPRARTAAWAGPGTLAACWPLRLQKCKSKQMWNTCEPNVKYTHFIDFSHIRFTFPCVVFDAVWNCSHARLLRYMRMEAWNKTGLTTKLCAALKIVFFRQRILLNDCFHRLINCINLWWQHSAD